MIQNQGKRNMAGLFLLAKERIRKKRGVGKRGKKKLVRLRAGLGRMATWAGERPCQPRESDAPKGVASTLSGEVASLERGLRYLG